MKPSENRFRYWLLLRLQYRDLDVTLNFFLFLCFTTFFVTFFKIKIFWFICILGAPKWLKKFFFVIFYKFGMYLTYKKWFWAHFSWFLGRGIYSTVWTRSGSKMKTQWLVFKGLKSALEHRNTGTITVKVLGKK